MQLSDNELLLQNAYKHEAESPNCVYMVQPLGGGEVKSYTWAETLDKARRLANYFASQNYPAGTRIAILSKNCAEFIITDLAIWMAGYVSVAIYPTLAADTVAYILEHSESKLIVVGKLDAWDSMKAGIPEDMPRIFQSMAPEQGEINLPWIFENTPPIDGSPVRGVEDEAVVIYTSGSTGRPKGVVHSFRAMCVAVKGAKQLIELTKEDRVISYLPLAHVYERSGIESSSLIIGNTVYFAESLETFNADMKRARPTFFHSVPRLWLKFQSGVFGQLPENKLNMLLRIPFVKNIIRKKLLVGLGLDACKVAISASAPIPPDVIRWYRESLGLDLLEVYGMSENFGYSHFSPPGKGRIGYVGAAMPNVEHRISDLGEIEVKSPGEMLEYYKMPDVTQESYTPDGYLKTGDRGEIDEDGRLKVTGRTKELFKTSKGKYVAPAPIENIINSNQHVELSLVAGVSQTSPHAMIVLSEDVRGKMNNDDVRKNVTTILSQLLEEVNTQVDPHEQLQFLTVVNEEWTTENGYLTPTMKVKRNIIEDAYESSVVDWYKSKEKIIWSD